MKPLFLVFCCGVTLSVLTGIQPRPADSATVLSADRAQDTVVVHNLAVKDGAVSGELLNKSAQPLRDVQLLIRYSWRWKNEFKPSTDDPGTAVFYTVDREIPPGGAVPFTYRPASPLPSRPDGYFETTVSVSGSMS